jgi:hypothetical protein
MFTSLCHSMWWRLSRSLKEILKFAFKLVWTSNNTDFPNFMFFTPYEQNDLFVNFSLQERHLRYLICYIKMSCCKMPHWKTCNRSYRKIYEVTFPYTKTSRIFCSLNVNWKAAVYLQLSRTIAFNVHGSVHRKNIIIYIQQDATLHSLFISGNCSTCFGW